MYTCLKSQLPLTGCERLCTMVCCIIRSISVILFITQGVFCAVVTGPSDATVLLDQTHELICIVAANDFPSWVEAFPNGTTERLYTVTNRFSQNSKYNNFNISGTLPDYNLRVETTQIEDEGVYQCATTESDISDARLSVEAEVTSVSITCQSPCEVEDKTIKVEEDTGCECTCSAFAGYPRDLVLMWSAGIQGVQTNNSAASGPTGTYDFDRTVSFTTMQNHKPLKCEVVGYTIKSIIDSEKIKTEVHFDILFSPKCEVTITGESRCNDVEVICNCTSNPPVHHFSFYKDGDLVSNYTTSRMITETFEEDVAVTLACMGYNTINNIEREGKSPNFLYENCRSPPTTLPPTTTVSTTVTTSLIEITSPMSTTAATTPTLMKTEMPTATTPTMTLMTTSTPDPTPVVLIVVLSCFGVILVAGGTGFTIYWFGFRTSDQESVKRSNNTGNNFDPPGGADNNTVTASTNETTNSAAPVYGVVNKSTKKKSDNTDGNGVNSKLQSEPDQVEYAAVNKPKPDPQPAPRSSKPPGNNTEPEKVELQYADIDHSNRGRSNEIHQPADAPTEYATVQSVIV